MSSNISHNNAAISAASFCEAILIIIKPTFHLYYLFGLSINPIVILRSNTNSLKGLKV